MAIDTAERRKAVAGINIGHGITPNASADAEWRQATGGSYPSALLGVLDDPVKNLDFRCVIGLDYPAMTGQFQDLFGADLSSANWIFTDYNGPPTVSGGALQIQLHGSSPREFAVTRPHVIPRDLTKAFTITINVTFPAADPIYDAVVTVGGINQALGVDYDPLRIVQQGSTRVAERGAGETGKIAHHIAGEFQSSVSNDLGSHKYDVIYDPAASNQLIVERDDAVIYTAPAGQTAPRPYYVMFGMLLRDEELTTANKTAILNGGTLASPTDLPIISVADITISCSSYESRTYPSWTSANAGGDIDTAAEGERFSLDGETWAIIPKAQISTIRVTAGRSLNTPNDSFAVELLAPSASDPSTYVFNSDRMIRRPILIDSRIGDPDAGTYGDWQRHICGIIDSKSRDGIRCSIVGRDRTSVKLDQFFSKGYHDLTIDSAVQEGADDGARNGLVLSAIFQDLVDVADALYGDKLGDTQTLFRLIDQAPQVLDTGGGSTISVLQGWADRGAQEMWREYSVSGDARYGRLRTNTWTLDGPSVYTFRAYGASNPNVLMPGVQFVQDARKGPGQTWYRNDSPAGAFEGLNTGHVPVVGVFPSFQYPPTDRILNDSYGQHADAAAWTILTLKDRDNNNVIGGVAQKRYQLENTFRRQIEFGVIGHNWMQPGLLFEMSDANGTGITTAEKWSIENFETVITHFSLKSRIRASSVDWLTAIRETM